MTDFGVTSAGFVSKTQQDILDEFESQERATIDPLIDVSAEQPLGQLNGIYSRPIAELWELAKVCYDAFDPDRAEEDRLTSLCKLTGATRRAATYTQVIVECDLDAGTTLESGVNFVHLNGNPDVRFTPVTDFTAPVDTVSALPFRAENTGPIAAPANTLNVIATPVSGWNAANNPAGETALGLPVDSDETLRERRELTLQATGSSTIDALRADVLRTTLPDDDVEFVESCFVFENITDATDGNGLPPHSFEVLVYDGAAPTSDQSDAIAQTIWDNRPAGIRSFGSSSGTATDVHGNPQTVFFSRVTAKNVWLEYDVVVDGSYGGDTPFKEFVKSSANSFFNEAGDDVIAAKLKAVGVLFPGVTDLTALRLGFAASPVGTTNLTIGIRDLARFDTTRISVSH